MAKAECLLLSKSVKKQIMHNLAPAPSFGPTSRAHWTLPMMLLGGGEYISASNFKTLINSLCRNTKFSIQCFHRWLKTTLPSKVQLHHLNVHSLAVDLQAPSTKTALAGWFSKAYSFSRVHIVMATSLRQVMPSNTLRLSLLPLMIKRMIARTLPLFSDV